MSEQKDEKGTGTTELTADITQINADEGAPICVHLCSSAVDQFVQGTKKSESTENA